MKQLLKKIYQKIPFKRQFFQVLRIFPIPHCIYQHLHFNGNIKVRIDKCHSFKMYHYGNMIENEIFWKGLYGGWEKLSMKLWVELCKKSEVIIDIGANTGLYALVAQSVNPNAQVYAFEPVKRVYKKIQHNIQINKFPIKSYELAVSNKDGEAYIYDIDSEHIYSVAVNKNLFSSDVKTHKVAINTIQLATFIKQENIKKIDLIKIDVETHEPEVLEGMQDFLIRFKPTLLIEILNDEVAHRVNNILSGLGYLYFDIDETALPQQKSHISKSSHFNYLICQPDIAKKLGLS